MKYREPTKTFPLRIWRKNNRVPLRELEKITGVDYSYLHRLEKGWYEATPETARKIFKGLQRWEVKNKPEVMTSFPNI
jgi:hypothetical protein